MTAPLYDLRATRHSADKEVRMRPESYSTVLIPVDSDSQVPATNTGRVLTRSSQSVTGWLCEQNSCPTTAPAVNEAVFVNTAATPGTAAFTASSAHDESLRQATLKSSGNGGKRLLTSARAKNDSEDISEVGLSDANAYRAKVIPSTEAGLQTTPDSLVSLAKGHRESEEFGVQGSPGFDSTQLVDDTGSRTVGSKITEVGGGSDTKGGTVGIRCLTSVSQSRRGSSVTFTLPAHVSSPQTSSSSSSHQQSLLYFDDDCSEDRRRFSNLFDRRMSAPELPPIADREKPRPASRSTSKSSFNQLAAAVSSKSFYNRQQNGTRLPRNHSDSSLKGLLSNSNQSHSQGSSSLNSLPTGTLPSTFSHGPEQLLPPHQNPHHNSRTLSLGAAENAVGSVPKLETLFEMKVSNTTTSTYNERSTSVNYNKGSPRTTSPQIINNNHDTFVFPSRSVSVNGGRKSASPELVNVTRRKKGLQSESGRVEAETIGTIEQFGRMKVNGMRRSISDNKLVDRANGKNTRLNSNRNQSGDRKDFKGLNRSLASSRQGTSMANGLTKANMRRVNSVSAINVSANNQHSRRDSVFADGVEAEGHSEGSEEEKEEEERTLRIEQWLIGVDFADAEDPPEPEIEYDDDHPPQTDTAIHIVHEGD